MNHDQGIDVEHQKLILIKRAQKLHEEMLTNPKLKDYVISFDDKDLAYSSQDK